MWNRLQFVQLGITSTCIIALTGCEQLPGKGGAQGGVIGGASGAAVGAAVAGGGNRGVGALIGGAVGATGGYLIGAHRQKVIDNDTQGAAQADRKSHEAPATAADARGAATADINNDGFVTLDEVSALQQTGLTDDQMIERLRGTGQIFELTSQQQDYLRQSGVSQRVIDQMLHMNQGDVLPSSDRVIGGRPTGTP